MYLTGAIRPASLPSSTLFVGCYYVQSGGMNFPSKLLMLLLFELGCYFSFCAAVYQLIPTGTVLAILTVRSALGNCTTTRPTFGQDTQPLC